MRFGTFSYNQARPWVSEKQAFEELLEQILLTERLGFDEAWFAEHHHSDYGLIASPNLMIASLAHRTKRLRLGNLVNVLPLYDPMRLAEECGMLDILTGGRLNVGLGRGVPRDDLKHGLDRDTAQARFEFLGARVAAVETGRRGRRGSGDAGLLGHAPQGGPASR